jgi:Skp family chaperone for outer membrane proteins
MEPGVYYRTTNNTGLSYPLIGFSNNSTTTFRELVREGSLDQIGQKLDYYHKKLDQLSLKLQNEEEELKKQHQKHEEELKKQHQKHEEELKKQHQKHEEELKKQHQKHEEELKKQHERFNEEIRELKQEMNISKDLLRKIQVERDELLNPSECPMCHSTPVKRICSNCGFEI